MLRHRWNISAARARELQNRLARQIRQEQLPAAPRTIAGVDCAFLEAGEKILAGAVLCDATSMAVLSEVHVVQPCRFPYVPGLLSFREAPAVIATVRKLPERPDLLMVDGQGLAHPRGVGLACHVGRSFVSKAPLSGPYSARGRASSRSTSPWATE